MADVTAASAREEWWQTWWRADFSWEGLKSRPANGWYVRPDGKMTRDPKDTPKTRAATLQDVWRSEAKRLVTAPDLSQWTVAHVPQKWADGSPAKSNWTSEQKSSVDISLADAIARFPNDGSDLIPTVPSSLGQKTRTSKRLAGIPLDGIILTDLPSAVQSLALLRSDYFGFLGEKAAVVGAQSAFLRWAYFETTFAIEGNHRTGQIIDLMRPVFQSGFVVSNSKPRSVIARNIISFGAIDLDLVDAFDQINFRGSKITGDVSFEDVKARKIDLASCEIDGDFRISDAEANLDVSRTKVSNNIYFTELLCASISATEIHVKGSAEFRGIRVSGISDFTKSVWDKSVDFDETRFCPVRFDDAEFGGKASFNRARFDGPVSFVRAHFHHASDFKSTTWPKSIGDQDGAFREAHFDSFVDFQNANFRAFSAFNGATFKSEIRFDRDILQGYEVVREALRYAKDDSQKVALEHGFRSLKQAAESVRDRNLEQALFRYELIARRSQSTTNRGEKFLSWIYGFVAAYGSSCRRPLFVALAVWVIFASVYCCIGLAFGAPVLDGVAFHGSTVHPIVAESLSLSARSMFNLFGIWNVRHLNEADSTGTQLRLENFLLHGNALIGLVTRCTSSIQSVVSGILFFLVVLSARRKFQIS
ncbi:hypothetical protein KOAAANKH_00071 [Brevundimonas sp. NIBR10]|uniref:pentapeptide repeat-containing protein n=1 Tax=Brevundimonas sp. NIBR10 TaxID=3015997 RepID=UPI0022F18761|nr:pentapeptide repeat-containing protein [Brevundimonas sp. NIBR10]WGM45211.1 hypothetical protein KOAAANKH_00071 [Brevundimonas sp. NIBR10]